LPDPGNPNISIFIFIFFTYILIFSINKENKNIKMIHDNFR